MSNAQNARREEGTAGPILLEVKDLKVHFPVRRGIFRRAVGYVKAVDGVSFELREGRTLALVGESGCGKTTTGRSLLQLVKSKSGSIEFDGQNIGALRGGAMQTLRRHIQFIFQDPFASLDPRMTVGYSIMEPLLIHGVARGRQHGQRDVPRALGGPGDTAAVGTASSAEAVVVAARDRRRVPFGRPLPHLRISLP